MAAAGGVVIRTSGVAADAAGGGAAAGCGAERGGTGPPAGRPSAGTGSRSRWRVERATAFGRGKERPDRPSELRLVQVADDPGPLDEADLAVLLRHDDHDASVCSVMPSAARWRVPNRSVWTVISASGSRAPAARIDLVADDHRAVVERRLGREDRPEQVGRDVGVDHHAGLGDLLEAGVALEHDQRAVAVGREQRGGVGDLVGDVLDGALLGRREEPVERPDPADPLERPAQLRLEDDDQREQPDDGARLEDLGQELEPEEAGRGVDGEQDGDADDEADGAGPADQAEEPVDEDRGDRDVDQRGQS